MHYSGRVDKCFTEGRMHFLAIVHSSKNSSPETERLPIADHSAVDSLSSLDAVTIGQKQTTSFLPRYLTSSDYQSPNPRDYRM